MTKELKPEELCDCPTWADFCPLQPKSSPMKRSRCWRCRLKVKVQLAKDTEVCPECVEGYIERGEPEGTFGSWYPCPTCNGSGRVANVGEIRSSPTIICLCGSTRFVDTFNEWRQRLTLEGKIVLSIELVSPQTEREDPQHSNFKVKRSLDELHLRKIDLADEVMILNVGWYIGESTRNELNYALKLGKPIIYLEGEK